MSEQSKEPVTKANLPLEPAQALIGAWEMVGRHPLFSAAVHGRASFEWLEPGALLVWRTAYERPGPPSGTAVIGCDDAGGACQMLYHDERGVSRIYQVSFAPGVWKMWREAPGFFQRLTGTMSQDSSTLVLHTELARDEVHWEPDLEVIYTRTGERTHRKGGE